MQGLDHEDLQPHGNAAAGEGVEGEGAERSWWDEAVELAGDAWDYITGTEAPPPPPVTIGSADWWVAYKAGDEATRQQLALSAWQGGELQAHIDALSVEQTTSVAQYQDELGEVLDYLQQFEMMRASGMTWEEMAAAQGSHMAAEARAAADAEHGGHATDEQVQEAHEESVADQDYITPPATTEWSRLSPDEQARWTVRGHAAIRAWCAHINATHPELGITESNVILAFQEVEELGASAYTINEGDAYIGRQVVTAIERDPAYADSTLIHEIVGHREFDSGFALSMELYDAAAPSLPGYNRPGDGTPERDAEWERFEYFESEIGALMRESSFWADSRDIDADGTVEASEENPLGAPGALLDTLLRNMADQWAPSLRSPYVTALVRRFEADPRIPDAAMTMLRDAVTRVLGITP